MNREFFNWVKTIYWPRRDLENMTFNEFINNDPIRNGTFHIMYTSGLEEAKINRDKDKYDRWGNYLD